MFRNRRALVLGAVLVLTLGAVIWNVMRPATGAAASSGARAPGPRPAGATEAALPAAESVRLAELTEPRDAPLPTTRNPFEFGSRPAPPVAAPAPSATTPVLRAPEQAAPAGAPPPPPIPLKFIGVVGRADGTSLAVLVPSGSEPASPLHGKEGDIIDGRYRILKIGTESIDMSYVDGRGRQTIRLTGQ